MEQMTGGDELEGQHLSLTGKYPVIGKILWKKGL
jgi:hypothetical protein